MATLPESRSDVLNMSDEYQDIKESKRRKFHPFRAVRNIFRRHLRRVDSEEFQQSANKSRSTTELLDPKTDAKARFPPSVPYAVGLSVSHDSIFSPDPSTISLDLSQHCSDFKNELRAKIHARRNSEEDEDVGLPHSPCTSPTTAEVLAQNLKTKNNTKLTATYSAGSLLSMASSENDEEIFGSMNTSKSAVDLNPDQPHPPLSHSAAHHKISVRPKRTHAKPRRKLCPSNLPSTPEVCEVSFPEATYVEPIVEENNIPPPIALSSKTPEPRKSLEPLSSSTKKPNPDSNKKANKDDSKGVFSMFRSRKGSDSEPLQDEPFFTRLFGSRRSNRKSKKSGSPHSEEYKGEHYRVLEPESPSYVSSNPKHNSYIYMGDNRMISNILPPLNVPKPISLMDSKSSPPSNGNSSLSYYTKDSNKITKVDESQNTMPRSQSYSSHRELDYFVTKESSSRPFPQSTSFNLFPKTIELEKKEESSKRFDDSCCLSSNSHHPIYGFKNDEEGARHTLDSSKSTQIETLIDESVAASKNETKTEESQTGGNGPLYFPIENTIESSVVDHDAPSLWSLESLSSLDDTGTKLKESREKLLEYLNPNKIPSGLTKLDDSNQFSSLQDYQKAIPVPKTLRSHSFKEYEKENSPRKTPKKQSTLPTILSKEDYDMLHTPEVAMEKETASPSIVTGDKVIQESPKPQPSSVKPTVVETKEASPSEKDIKISAPNPVFIKKENSIKSAKVSTPTTTSKYIYESENCPNKDTKKTTSLVNNVISTNGNSPKEVKPTKKEEITSKPSQNNTVMPKLVSDTEQPTVNKRPNKLNLVDVTKPLASSPETETPKEEAANKASASNETSQVSLVKRNKEMFRQLETKTYSNAASTPNKRNSLPPKVSFESLASIGGQNRTTPQSTPCTTPSEKGQSELMSVFSKRSSKQKFDEDQQNHNSLNNEASKIVNNNVININNNNASTPTGNNANFDAVAQTTSSINKDLPRKLSLKDSFLSTTPKESNKESPITPAVPKSPTFKVPTIPIKDTAQHLTSNKITTTSKPSEKSKNDNHIDNNVSQPKPALKSVVQNKNAINSNKDAANNLENLKEYVIPKSKDLESPSKKELIKDNATTKEALHCQRSRSMKCSSNINNETNSQAPAWLALAHQRREERQTTERKVSGSTDTVISNASLGKGSRSSKVLDMVNSYQKLQL